MILRNISPLKASSDLQDPVNERERSGDRLYDTPAVRQAFAQLCWSIVESVTASLSFIGSAMLTNYLLLKGTVQRD
jgi:hypothetical protein